ncbi:MAG: hypothetical protein IPN09_14285 [Bacteroidetes bacterium]|nr:hypothetical protein [Bacteroidota bacterium]
MVAIDAQHPILPGDIVKVRIELRVDRDMEYIHMKDMRSIGLESINVLSGFPNIRMDWATRKYQRCCNAILLITCQKGLMFLSIH